MPRKKEASKTKTIAVTWKHSTIGRTDNQAATIKALGFTKLNQTLYKVDNPAIRGMIKSIEHLLEVKEDA
jgi:large subunit ribosomal protein L30